MQSVYSLFFGLSRAIKLSFFYKAELWLFDIYKRHEVCSYYRCMDSEIISFEKIKETSILYKIPLGLGVVGALSIIIGFFLILRHPKSTIQFTTDEASESAGPIGEIMVDVEGAVTSPGVYTLPVGCRVADAVAKAGGFSSSSDTLWITKNLNQAQKISDGTKLYIPTKGEVVVKEANVFGVSSGGVVVGSSAHGQTNLNRASKSELEGLYRIGPVTADKIINNRPYQTIEELLSKKVVSQSVFDAIKEEITIE